MKRADQNFLIDIFGFILFILLAATGLFLYFKLPPGSQGAAVWGLSRHTWGDIHFGIAIGFLALMAFHLILHWNWIICMIKGRYKNMGKQKKNITLSLVVLILLFVISILPFLSSVDQDDSRQRRNMGRGYGIERNQ